MPNTHSLKIGDRVQYDREAGPIGLDYYHGFKGVVTGVSLGGALVDWDNGRSGNHSIEYIKPLDEPKAPEGPFLVLSAIHFDNFTSLEDAQKYAKERSKDYPGTAYSVLKPVKTYETVVTTEMKETVHG